MTQQLRMLRMTCASKAKPRTVILNRTEKKEVLHFNVLGGLERGCGIYVSQVEKGSKAHEIGLKRGDQVSRHTIIYFHTLHSNFHSDLSRLKSLWSSVSGLMGRSTRPPQDPPALLHDFFATITSTIEASVHLIIIIKHFYSAPSRYLLRGASTIF